VPPGAPEQPVLRSASGECVKFTMGVRTERNEMGDPHLEKKMGTQMNRRSIWQSLPFLSVAVALFLSFAAGASAQDDPSTRVARLGFIEGSVSFQPAGTQDWVDANPNRPLTTGDNLWADDNSRSELHIGSTAIRLSGQTGISIMNLNDATAQIQLAQGTIDVRVREIGENEAYEIDTANMAFSVLRPGEYRVSVDPNGTTTMVTVRGGAGEATAGGQAYPLNPGEQGVFAGTDQVTYNVQGAPAPDGFDEWCTSRDMREDHSASARYVSRDMIGYEDLDQYGHWQQVPDYGNVWIPNGTPEGWAPYHNGHWISVAPWGWTWVEDEPWGFAPFHYGRWAVVGGGWCWVPGPVAVAPVYAPALVAFVGGRGFGVSLEMGGGAAVAWFPLGPRDVFVPAYHVSPRYEENINITNTTVINRTYVNNYYTNVQTNNVSVTNIRYANQAAPGAVTVVSRDTFVNARPVATATIRATPQQLASAHVSAGAPLAPSRASVVGPGRVATASARPPAALAARPVVTRIPPPANAAPMGKVQPHPTVAPAAAGRPGTPPAPGHPNVAPTPAPNAARPANTPPPPPARPAAAPNQPAARPAPATNVPPPYPNNRPPAANQPAVKPNAPPAPQPKPATPPAASRPNYPPQPTEKPAPARPSPAPAEQPRPATSPVPQPKPQTPPPAKFNPPPPQQHAQPQAQPREAPKPETKPPANNQKPPQKPEKKEKDKDQPKQ
jgi:hypothetical protein